MSSIEFINGATVNRLYNDLSDGELLAAFQYASDAVDFAQAKCLEDIKNDWFNSLYAVADLGTGKVFLFRPKKNEPKAKVQS